jgi:general secretion pathway protein L
MQSPILIQPPRVSPRDSNAPAEHRWQWTCGDNGVQDGPLDACANWIRGLPGHHDVVLLIPAEHVLLTQAEMPASSPERTSRALPYALENHLLEDPADLHCVAGPRLSQQHQAAGVIHAALLEGWLSELAVEDIAPLAAVADALCLPWQENEIHILEDGDRLLIRWDHCAAVTTDGDTGSVLAIIEAEATGATRVTHKTGVNQAPLNLLLEGVANNPINFLSGSFLPQIKKAGWNAWRWPVGLLAASLLLTFTLQGLVNSKLENENQRLETLIRTQFAAAFPEIRRMQTDPAPQIEMELRKLQGGQSASGGSFLTLMQDSSPLISSSPGVTLERIHYRDSRLELSLSARQLPDLEGLRLRLVAAGLDATQGATRLDGDRVTGSLLIESAPGGLRK